MFSKVVHLPCAEELKRSRQLAAQLEVQLRRDPGSREFWFGGFRCFLGHVGHCRPYQTTGCILLSYFSAGCREFFQTAQHGNGANSDIHSTNDSNPDKNYKDNALRSQKEDHQRH